MPSPLSTKYALKSDNFILDPVKDTDCFALLDLDPVQIAESLDTDLVTDLAPKRMFWGPYGGGKTHTLMRTMRELEKLTPIHAVRVECPDLAKKSRFHDLYREGIMRELGEGLVIGLIDDAVRSVGMARREELTTKLRERFEDEEVAKAAIRLIDPNFDSLRLWRWISGVALARADLDDLGQTQDLTQTESARLADLLSLLGRLMREFRQKKLVLVLDEMERLNQIGPETTTTFVSGFTRLVDPTQKDVCVLIGASASLQTELVDIFSEGSPVVSRLTSENIQEVSYMHDEDLDRLIETVVAYRRDETADINAIIAAAQATTTEPIEERFFPFTTTAVDALKSGLTNAMTPREITMKMTRALGRSYRGNASAITSHYAN
jgi:Cdc6-like AAA superfamily ATPase